MNNEKPKSTVYSHALQPHLRRARSTTHSHATPSPICTVSFTRGFDRSLTSPPHRRSPWTPPSLRRKFQFSSGIVLSSYSLSVRHCGQIKDMEKTDSPSLRGREGGRWGAEVAEAAAAQRGWGGGSGWAKRLRWRRRRRRLRSRRRAWSGWGRIGSA